MRHKHAPTRTCKGMEVDEHRLILRSTGETRIVAPKVKKGPREQGWAFEESRPQERANSALVLKVHTFALILLLHAGGNHR